jgi:hypothetical protein
MGGHAPGDKLQLTRPSHRGLRSVLSRESSKLKAQSSKEARVGELHFRGSMTMERGMKSEIRNQKLEAWNFELPWSFEL